MPFRPYDIVAGYPGMYQVVAPSRRHYLIPTGVLYEDDQYQSIHERSERP